jgi:WD40 repeat protein
MPETRPLPPAHRDHLPASGIHPKAEAKSALSETRKTAFEGSMSQVMNLHMETLNFEHPFCAHCCSAHPRCAAAAGTGADPIRNLSLENASLIDQVGYIQQPNRWQMLSLAWSPDGAHLAMTTDGGVRTTDFLPECMRPGQRYGSTSVKCVAYSPDGKLLAACNTHDGTIFVWNAATGEQAAAIYTGSYAAEEVEFSPDGTLLAVRNGFSDDKEVTLWGVWANGARQPLTASNAYRVQNLATFAHGVPVIDMSFNPDGGLLATITASEGRLRV